MAQTYSGELQDYEGNTIYPHTESDVVWMEDGSSLGDFSRKKSDEEIGILIDAILNN